MDERLLERVRLIAEYNAALTPSDRQDLRTLLAAARQGEPVAWMYTNETGGKLVELHRWRYGGELKSWTETPLYAPTEVGHDRK